MATSHHGTAEQPDHRSEAELQKRFLEQIEGRAKRFYEHGRIKPTDEGSLACAMRADKEHGVVVLDFGKAVTWIALTPRDVAALVEQLIQKAKEVAKEPFSVTIG